MITVKTVERVNPRAPEEPHKFYGMAQSTGEIGLTDLAKKISKSTTLGVPDVYAVIMALMIELPELLLEGKIVKLGEFGTFRVTVSSDGVATVNEYSTTLIKKANLNFRPGKAIADALSSAVFKKVS